MKKFIFFFYAASFSIWAQSAEFYYNKAVESYSSENYQKALEFSRKAESLIQTYTDKLQNITLDKLYSLIGDCEAQLKNDYEAKDYYKKSLALNEKQPKLLYYLAWFHEQKRYYRESVEYFELYTALSAESQKIPPIFLLHYALTLSRLSLENKIPEIIKLNKQIDTTQLEKCNQFEKSKQFKASLNCLISYTLHNLDEPEYFLKIIRLFRTHTFREPLQRPKPISKDTLWMDELSTADAKISMKNWAQFAYFLYRSRETKYSWPYFYMLYEEEKYVQALEVLDTILQKEQNKNIFFWKAELLRNLQKADEAQIWYEKASKENR